MTANDTPARHIAPPAFLADPALRAILAALPRARLVGGCVRDALAHRQVADIDIATPDPPEQVMAALAAAGLRAVPTGLAHGTVTAVADHRGFEITTLRRDLTTDGRHAEVGWTDDWRADAARRDFTINAMSLRPDGALFDYFGGIADLAAHQVRFVGDPATRIAEDRLRVLRYFRFLARFGAGTAPDAATLAAIEAAAPHLVELSTERVWSELKRLLAAPDPTAAIALMERLGVFAPLLPEGVAPARLAAMVGRGAPADPLLRLAALTDAPADTIAARFKLANAEHATLAELRAAPLATPDLSPPDRRRLLADWPAAALIGRIWLDGGQGPAWADLRADLAATARPVFPLAGRDALDLGAPPGPAVGAALRAARAWWFAGGCTATARACRARLAEILRA